MSLATFLSELHTIFPNITSQVLSPKDTALPPSEDAGNVTVHLQK